MNKFHITYFFSIICIVCTVNCIANTGYLSEKIAYSHNNSICPMFGYYSPTIGTTCPMFGHASPSFGYVSPTFGYASPTNGTTCPMFGYASPSFSHASPDLRYLINKDDRHTTFTLAIFLFMGTLPLMVGAVPP